MLRILTHETAEITAVVSWPKASGCCLKIRMTRNSAGNFSGTWYCSNNMISKNIRLKHNTKHFCPHTKTLKRIPMKHEKHIVVLLSYLLGAGVVLADDVVDWLVLLWLEDAPEGGSWDEIDAICRCFLMASAWPDTACNLSARLPSKADILTEEGSITGCRPT